MKRPVVIVVGAGISGLTVSYELLRLAQRRGRPIELMCLEASTRAGGNIRSERESGFLCEWGPNGFLDNAPATLALVRDLGIEERLVRASAAAATRFIYRGGKLREVPTGPGAFLTSGVLPLADRLRVFGEPFVSGRRDDADESVFDFAARRIGPGAARILVDAMVSGVYAGDARRLSLPATFPKMRRMEAEHGSLFRAMLALRKQARREGGSAGGPSGPGGRLTSFRDGMEQLIHALATALDERLELGREVTAVSDLGQRGLRVHTAEGAPLDAAAVVLACPAAHSARLVTSMDPELSRVMDEIRSAALAVLHFGYSADAIGNSKPGFGFLVPRGEGRRILGTLWSSQIFEGRAPESRRLLTTMIGGAHDPEAVELDNAELIRIVRDELGSLMQITVAPYFIKVFRHPAGIPQYTLGHPERIAAIEKRLTAHPGLLVSGNSYNGVSVNACVEEAPLCATRIFEHLDSRESAA